MSNNLMIVQQKPLDQYLETLMWESFKKESIIYKKTDKLRNIKTPESLYNYINRDKQNFQKELEKALYGEDNLSFIKYFYDVNFRNQIIKTGQVSLSSKINKNEMKNLTGKIKSLANESIIKNKTIAERKNNFKDGEIVENIYEIIKEINDQANDILLKDSIFNAIMDFDFNIYGAKGLNTVKFSDTKKDIKNQQKNIKKNIGLRWKANFSQKDFINLIKDVISRYNYEIDNIDKNNKDAKISLSTSDNAFLIEYKHQQKEYNDKFNIVEIVLIYLNIIQDSINNINKEHGMDFYTWRKKNAIDGKLARILKNNETVRQKILNDNTSQSVIGTIGEVLFSLLIKNLGTNVEILGQTSHGTGYAAVDVSMSLTDKSNKIQELGFQVKNYTSITDTIVLYPQSNLLNKDDIKRYITDSSLSLIQHIIFSGYTEQKLRNESDRNNILTFVLNILNNHIPFYLRYDEANIFNDISHVKNNFYIINFHFIPASIILYLIKNYIDKINKENNFKNKKDMFYWSSTKQLASKNEILKSKNFINSWNSMYSKGMWPGEGKENSGEYLKNELYINFIGIKLKFKKELNMLLS